MMKIKFSTPVLTNSLQTTNIWFFHGEKLQRKNDAFGFFNQSKHALQLK
jgi:hypothetical protein